MGQIIKESIIVCVWIGCGALTIWGADSFGLLTSDIQRQHSSTLQVDFPEIFDIWKSGNAVFVDTRSSANFKRGHIPGAVNVPINRVKQTISVLPPTDTEVLLITYCGSVECPNAYQLMHVLLGDGYRNVKFFPRGMRGWLALGHPLETE